VVLSISVSPWTGFTYRDTSGSRDRGNLGLFVGTEGGLSIESRLSEESFAVATGASLAVCAIIGLRFVSGVVGRMAGPRLGESSLRRTGSDIVVSALRGASPEESERRWAVPSASLFAAETGNVKTAVVDTETSGEVRPSQ